MKIDRAFIFANLNERGGINSAQLHALGESLPIRKGWVARIEQRDLTQKQVDAFLKFREPAHAAAMRRRLRTERAFVAKEVQPVQVVPHGLEAPATDAFLRSHEWRRVRMIALKKYGARCQCCGATPATCAVMHVDHIKPRKFFPQLALDVTNLQVLCHECNHGKGSWDMTDWRVNTSGAS